MSAEDETVQHTASLAYNALLILVEYVLEDPEISDELRVRALTLVDEMVSNAGGDRNVN